MKYIKIIILIAICAGFASCKKDRFPTVENAANAQFTRDLGVVTSVASFNTANLSKATPTVQDKFTMKVYEEGTVLSVDIMVDYKKGATTLTQKYSSITSWPITAAVSLNDLIALFATQGVTSATVASGDKFVFRAVMNLKSGTVVSEQAAVLSAAPYAITLTYTVTN